MDERTFSTLPLRAGVCLLLASLLIWPTSGVDAQDLNYQSYLIGGRPLGMGGAFTGLADGAAAAYYNPAGLAQLARTSISGSLTLNALNRYVVENGYGTPGGATDLMHDSTPSIPVFVGVAKKFGPRDADRIRRHAIALSTVHPAQVNRGYELLVFDQGTGVSSSLRVDETDSVTWWGPSYAYRLSPAFALGISGFLVTRSFRHDEDEVIVSEGDRQPDGVYRNSTLSVRESIVELDARSLLFRLGALWDVSDSWRLGVMVQPPGIQLSGSARVFERRSFADLLSDPAIGTFFHSDQGDLDSESPIPWEVRLGAAYRHGDAFTTTMDLSVYGPLGSIDDPVRPIGDPTVDPDTGDVPQTGTFVVEQYSSRVSANLSLGMETVVADVIPLRAGVFSNLSAARSVERASNVYGPADVNGYGAALSVGIRSGGYDVSIGAAAIFGRGQGYRLNPEPGLAPNPEMYLPTGVESRTIFFFIDGHMNAAKRFAREVYDEYVRPEDERERRERERLLREELEQEMREELERRIQAMREAAPDVPASGADIEVDAPTEATPEAEPPGPVPAD